MELTCPTCRLVNRVAGLKRPNPNALDPSRVVARCGFCGAGRLIMRNWKIYHVGPMPADAECLLRRGPLNRQDGGRSPDRAAAPQQRKGDRDS